MPFRFYGGPPARLGALILTSVMAWSVHGVPVQDRGDFPGPHVPALATPTRVVPILLNILSSAFAAGLIVTHIVVLARNSHYFLASSPFVRRVPRVICCNAYFISLLIAGLNKRDSAYGEYLEFRRTTEGRTSGLSVLVTPGIQRKLIFSFVPLILVIILILSFVLMRDFSGTILASVIQDGKILAERTTSVIKANPGDMIGADDYLSFEAKTNASATFPFRTISFWRRDPQSDIFTVAASTNRALMGGRSNGKTEPFTEAVYRYDRPRRYSSSRGRSPWAANSWATSRWSTTGTSSTSRTSAPG